MLRLTLGDLNPREYILSGYAEKTSKLKKFEFRNPKERQFSILACTCCTSRFESSRLGGLANKDTEFNFANEGRDMLLNVHILGGDGDIDNLISMHLHLVS